VEQIRTTSTGIDVTGTVTVNSGNSAGTALTVEGESGSGLKTHYKFQDGSPQVNWQIGMATHASQTFSITPSTAAGNTTFTNSALNIDSSGNVGIGTLSPAGKVSIEGASATDQASHITFKNTQGSKVFAVGSGKAGVSNNGFSIVNVTDNTAPLTISDAGHMIVPQGITLGTAAGTYAAANTLDDYEEGTWTPTVVTGAASFTVNKATYTKVGRLVTVMAYISAFVSKDANQFKLSGLPFVASNDSYGTGIVDMESTDVALCRSNESSTDLVFFKADATRANFIGTNLSSHCIFSFAYETD